MSSNKFLFFFICGTNIEKPYKLHVIHTPHSANDLFIIFVSLSRALALFQIQSISSRPSRLMNTIDHTNKLTSQPANAANAKSARTHFANKHSNISNLTTVASCPQHVESAAQTTMQSAPKATQNAQIKLHRETFTNRIILFVSYFICILYR